MGKLLFIVSPYCCLRLYQIVKASYHIMNLSLLENAINNDFFEICTAFFKESEEKVLRVI
jgi:hypothetical protein